MSNTKQHITVFEHETIRHDKGEKRLTKAQYEALEHHYDSGVPYFSLVHNGVKFNNYVGVIQVGGLLIEVLPKADKAPRTPSVENKWRNLLIGMLCAVGSFDIQQTSNSHLKIKPNTILDLYFELFIKEIEYLLHNGLVKQYRKKEGNSTALKGNLQFAKHIPQNLTHQERFYVRHTTYDVEHKWHIIIYKTLRLLKQINTNTALQSRIGALLLHFPEMPDRAITEATFNALVFNRKTHSYKKAMDIAKLILLQYHPDISHGRHHVLALMFDMNRLWEQFVFVTLRQQKDAQITVTAQTSKDFWQPDNGYKSKMRPDIWLKKGDECNILDTKWKNLNGYNPSPEDLRQMYVYHEYYDAKKVALVYPNHEDKEISGIYIKTKDGQTEKKCSVILLATPDKIENNQGLVKIWQENIRCKIGDWVK